MKIKEKKATELKQLVEEINLDELLKGPVKEMENKREAFKNLFEFMPPEYYDTLTIGHPHWSIIGEASSVYNEIDDRLEIINKK